MNQTKRVTRASLTLAAVLAACAPAALAANIAVVGGKTDDEFWNRIKKGLDDAALIVGQQGGSVSYLQLQTYDNLGPDAAQLVRTAISQGVDGIAVPNWVPEAQDEAIKAAVDAGIEVILINAGTIDKARELGAINYVGSDEYVAGVAAGEYFGEHGAKNIVCVTAVPGAANHEARCQGVVDGAASKGAAASKLPLPGSAFGDRVAIAETIKATVLQDDTIDGIITTSATDADGGAIGLSQAGKTETVMLRESADVLAHVHVGDTFNHKASSGLRYILNPPGTQTRVHQHLDIGQGEVPWDDFFGTLAEIGFDGIMTACVFAWEEKADASGRFMRAEMQRYVDKFWK
ncbi:substrate-binding domain-containing protein [Amaricoccus sp.]|uniref:substrate-binding domain-containing protein n=1 Tax=Amaricoccus sp. TaxID=1872485 RepID=UPI0026201445|nr:substrate-binding domain-containing protein [Amaricoccus sp.]HRO10940.1 substrate-binding domain-containing protein [Amaricoccus sp.]